MASAVSMLEVLFYGEVIGTLTRLADDRTLFAFDEAYEPPPISWTPS
jgi:hypothetical protein